jgi:hypothetical protein
MAGVVAPVLKVPPVFPESTTLPPVHKATGPPAVMIEATGGVPLVTILLCNAIAPARDSPRPKSDALSSKLIAPFAMMVPIKTEPAPRSTWPFICQYTLHEEAPFTNTTLDRLVVDSAPFILKIKMAPAFPPASNTRSPFNVEAAPKQ